MHLLQVEHQAVRALGDEGVQHFASLGAMHQRAGETINGGIRKIRARDLQHIVPLHSYITYEPVEKFQKN